MPRLQSLAVAQTTPIPGDVYRNLEEHLRLTGLAAALGARIVVFPELSLTGYEIERARELAFDLNDARLTPLGERAADLSITIVAGAPIRSGSCLHIGAVVLDPGGGRSVYTKQRLGAFPERARRDGTLPPPEATVFEPGDRDPLVSVAGASAALAICADIGSPCHPEAAVARGADAYLTSVFSIPSEIEADLSRLASYATRYAVVVAMANFGGTTGKLAAAGRSSIWSPSGDLVAQLGRSGSGIAVAIHDGVAWRGTTTMPGIGVAGTTGSE